MLIDKKEIKITGRFIKKVELTEDWDEEIDDPEMFVKKLKESRIRADLFTFLQKLPESKPKYDYHIEWDSIAAIPILTYENWYKYQLHQNPRNKMRIAEKKGVTIKICDFNDELIKGITEIYNETPIRQRKYFPHYGMNLNTTRNAHVTFLDRSYFLGAFFQNELIGFIKLTATKNYMRTMGILAKVAHRDKAPMNLLIAKAVEICAEKGIPYLVYAKYNYGHVGSDTLKEFKGYLGFESIILPRYYVPLNTFGKILVKFNFHHDLIDMIPKKLLKLLLKFRDQWHIWKYSK